MLTAPGTAPVSEILVHDRQQARLSAAAVYRLARGRPSARVRAGWFLVDAGFRLATDRRLRSRRRLDETRDRSVAVLSWVRC